LLVVIHSCSDVTWQEMRRLLISLAHTFEKKHKILHFKQAQTGQNSRPDPRRDSCIYVVTDTSGSSECTLNNNT